MKNLFKKARILSMVILVLTFLGCEDDDDGTALPAVTAGFTFDLIQGSGTVSFINISENANTFEWDFGNGTTSTEINPTVTFVSGTYTVGLTANNVAGASDTFEDEITITIPEPPGPIVLPLDFDGANVAYDAIVGDNIGFSVVTNPETANGNTTNVGQMTAGGGQFQNVQFPLGTAVDFSGENKTIQLDLFSSAEIAVLVKFEDGVDGARDVEVLTTHTGSGWETLNFNFATDAVASFIEGDPQNGQALVADGQYAKIILFIGFNTDPGVEGTFLVDNVVQTASDGGGNMNGGSLEDCGGELVNDFESSDDSIFSNFGGGVGTIIDNPDTSVNMSAKVGQYVKNAGEVFGGITIEVDPDIDFNAGVFSIDVYSQAVRQLLFKLEGLNIEAIVPTSGTGWETITYDFSAVGGNMGAVTALTLIMDNGTVGDGSADWTIQFDNIRLCSNEITGGGNSLEDCGGDLVNDFETADDSIFSNFGGGVGTIIDNPDTSLNMSAQLGQYVKNAGEVFGGITIEVDPDIDFNAGVFSIDVNSQAVRQLLFKLEGLNIEAIIPTSGTGWETITYDFSAVGGNLGAVTAITLIMDNGTAGDGSADWTIQFDNIRLCSNQTGGGSSCPAPPTGELLSNGGFEANSGDGACWQLNPGGGAVTIIDTDANTGTYSARLTSGPAQVPNLKQERFATNIAGNQDVQVTFRYQITTPFVDGAILQVLAFSERSANGAVAHDLGNAGDTSTTGTWLTYTGTFSTDAAVDEGISLLIQATCGGAGTCAGEVLIDDVMVTNI
ncbi:MAG: PKD domain-containing protein [Bacteroidota bacterium]